METIWVVGKIKAKIYSGIVWEIQGVFDSEQKAVKACGEYKNYFIGPLKLNEVLPNMTFEWPGVYYPNERI